MTIAETIAALLGDDGQVFTARDGRTLDEVCRDVGARVTTDGFDKTRYDFDDGSSIVVAGAAWDLGLPGGCYCWEGANGGRHADECRVPGQELVRRAVDLSGLSVRAFAVDVMAGRDERTVRRWLDGSSPVPDQTFAWLTRYVEEHA